MEPGGPARTGLRRRIGLPALAVASAIAACQGRPPSIGHFVLGFDQGGKHAVPPDTVIRCSAEERDLAFGDTITYLHADEDDRARPTTACCTPGSNTWEFLLPPWPELGHVCKVVRWERDGFIHVEHKDAYCDKFQQRDGCVGIARR